MLLSTYHRKYADQSDGEIARRIEAKRQELLAIKAAGIEPTTSNEELGICVMGCGDKRFIQGHRQIFQDVFARPTKVVTLDISVEHLEGERDVIQHDISKPLPRGPYDITYAHVVLKFVPKISHGDVIENSYSALTDGGIAIHVLDKEDYMDPDKVRASGYHPVDLAEIKDKLKESQMRFIEVSVKYGIALILRK